MKKPVMTVIICLAMCGFLSFFQDRAVPQEMGSDYAKLEGEIFAEANLLRKDPSSFIQSLEELRPKFSGNILNAGMYRIHTREGVAAVDEAIAFLKNAAPQPELRITPGLQRAARDHQADQAKSGALGHKGADGSMPANRIARYGRSGTRTGECITYGSYCSGGTVTGRDIIIQLLVDDGIRDRAHRKNLFEPTFRTTGIACGPHPRLQLSCVINYAGEFEEK